MEVHFPGSQAGDVGRRDQEKGAGSAPEKTSGGAIGNIRGGGQEREALAEGAIEEELTERSWVWGISQ